MNNLITRLRFQIPFISFSNDPDDGYKEIAKYTKNGVTTLEYDSLSNFGKLILEFEQDYNIFLKITAYCNNISRNEFVNLIDTKLFPIIDKQVSMFSKNFIRDGIDVTVMKRTVVVTVQYEIENG